MTDPFLNATPLYQAAKAHNTARGPAFEVYGRRPAPLWRYAIWVLIGLAVIAAAVGFGRGMGG